MSTSTTTPAAGASAAPSTSPAGQKLQGKGLQSFPRVGDTILVMVASNLVRPLLVTSVQGVTVNASATPQTNPAQEKRETRVSGTIFCEPEDHTLPAFRGWTYGTQDPARIHGRPDRMSPFGFGEHLRRGTGIGEWQMRPEGQ